MLATAAHNVLFLWPLRIPASIVHVGDRVGTSTPATTTLRTYKHATSDKWSCKNIRAAGCFFHPRRHQPLSRLSSAAPTYRPETWGLTAR